MEVTKINIEKARNLKKMMKENPEYAKDFYLRNELFYAIIGKKEFFEMYETIPENDKREIVLISITEPDNDYIEEKYKKGFHEVLETKFWDIEEDTTDNNGNFYPKITKEEGKRIKEFIEKNKNKRFIIHCAAGVSRSAGIGISAECLINYDGCVYTYQTSFSSIKEHPRYAPNRTVFDAICKE